MTAEEPSEPDREAPLVVDLTGEARNQPLDPDADHSRVSPLLQAAIAAALLAVVGAAGWLIGGSDTAPDRVAAPVAAETSTPVLVPAPEVPVPPTPTPTPSPAPERSPQRSADAGASRSFGVTLRPGAAELAAPIYVQRLSDSASFVWFSVGPGLRLEGTTSALSGFRSLDEDLLDTSIDGRVLAAIGDGLLVEPNNASSGSLAYWVLESGLTPLRDGEPGDIRFLGAAGGLAAIVERDGGLAVVDVWTGANVSSIRTGGPAPVSACFSPDERSLAIVRPDGTVDVVAVSSGVPVVELDEVEPSVSWLDARTLVVLVPSRNATFIRLIDIDSGAATDVARLDGIGEWRLDEPASTCPGVAVDANPVPAIVPLRTIDALQAPIILWPGDGAETSLLLDPTGAITEVTTQQAPAVGDDFRLPPHAIPENSTLLTARDDVAVVTTGDQMVAYDLRTDEELLRAPADHLGDRVARACFNHDQTVLAVVTGRGEGAIYDLASGQKRRGYTTDAVVGGGVWTTADQFAWLQADDAGARLLRVVDLSSGLARNVARLDAAAGWQLSAQAGLC